MGIIIESIKDVSVVGSSPIIFLVAFLAALYMFARGDYIRVGTLILSLISGLYSSVLKYLFNEQRPAGYISDGLIPWERVLKSEVYSFPSTHTVLYTVFFGYLFYLTFKLSNIGKILRHTTRIFCALMIVLVGVSRILIGAHFVKDVVFGYLFGLLYLGAVIYVEGLLERKRAKKQLKHRRP